MIGDEGAERFGGFAVTHDYLEALGVKPLLGRLFVAEDDRLGVEPTAILGEGAWRSRFNARASAIGESILLNGRAYNIIGVLPAMYPSAWVNVWTPIGLDTDQPGMLNRRNHPGFQTIGRLKEGVGIDLARSEMEAIASQLAAEYPRANKGCTVEVEFLEKRLSSGSKSALIPLLIASGLLFLIACANVANLQLVRAYARKPEFAVRVALGAAKRHIFSQLAIESLLLGLIGGIAGIVLASFSVSWFKVSLFSNLPRISDMEIGGAALAYAVVVSIVSSMLFGMASMWQATRRTQQGALAEGPRNSGSVKGRKWKAGLVVCEFALTGVLLTWAGLMLRTTANLYSSDPGFETERRLVFNWALPQYEYEDNGYKRFEAMEHVRGNLAELSGVMDAALVSTLPLSGHGINNPYYVDGAPLPEEGEGRDVQRIRVSGNYFQVAGIQLIAGRGFNEFDTRDSQRVVIVDETFAQRCFPNSNPIGERLVFGNGPPENEDRWYTIVGLVNHVKQFGVKANSREQVYHPIRQNSGLNVWFLLETETDVPMTLVEAVKMKVNEAALNIPIERIGAYDTMFADGASNERVMVQVLGILSALALLLSGVGLYGVLSYSVGLRLKEISIRMAIGATARSVRDLMFLSSAKLVGAGLLISLVGSVGLSRFLSSMLYGVSALDGVTLGSVTLVLVVVGFLGCWVPASRASRIQPVQALRGE